MPRRRDDDRVRMRPADRWRRARFGLPEARWNFPAQWLGALARQVLPAHCLELALLADEQLPASRLAEMGWLNRVVADGEARPEALAWAHRLAGFAPRSLRHFKELIQLGAWATPEAALARGHQQALDLMGMADTAEGGRPSPNDVLRTSRTADARGATGAVR